MIKDYLASLLEKDNFWYLLGLLCLLSVLSLFITHDIIITEPQYFTGGNQNSVKLYRQVYFALYFVQPLYCFIKVLIIAGLLNFGLQSIKIKVSFKQLMLVVIVAKLVYWMQDLSKVIWFLFINTSYTMQDVDYFSFLSLQNLISPDISGGYKLIVQFISIPELLFILTLVLGLQVLANESFSRMAKVTLSTYGIAMFLSLLIRSYMLHQVTF
ncbi:MAG TPA: hypothetical protein ENN33_02660 [Ignavibacteria bacterium]|nr:hypothetical protein [Ignavibacteria bacterium]